MLNVLCGVHRVVGEDELGALPAVGVRDFDGNGHSGEVGEDEQLGGAVVASERVDLVVLGEQHVEVAVRDGGLGAAQLDQPPVVVEHRVVVGDLGLRVDLLVVGVDRDPRCAGGEACVSGVVPLHRRTGIVAAADA